MPVCVVFMEIILFASTCSTFQRVSLVGHVTRIVTACPLSVTSYFVVHAVSVNVRLFVPSVAVGGHEIFVM